MFCPNCESSVDAANAVLPIAYIVLLNFSTSGYGIATEDIVSTITTVIISAIMLGANNVYFQNRSHLFTK